LTYIIVAEGSSENMNAFAAGLASICKTPPAGVEVNPTETKFRFDEVGFDVSPKRGD
jgi:hypothetical protein